MWHNDGDHSTKRKGLAITTVDSVSKNGIRSPMVNQEEDRDHDDDDGDGTSFEERSDAHRVDDKKAFLRAEEEEEKDFERPVLREKLPDMQTAKLDASFQRSGQEKNNDCNARPDSDDDYDDDDNDNGCDERNSENDDPLRKGRGCQFDSNEDENDSESSAFESKKLSSSSSSTSSSSSLSSLLSSRSSSCSSILSNDSESNIDDGDSNDGDEVNESNDNGSNPDEFLFPSKSVSSFVASPPPSSSCNSSSSSFCLSTDAADPVLNAQRKKLHKKFQVRDQILKRITRNKDEEYVNFVKQTEDAVRKESIRVLERRWKQRLLSRKQQQEHQQGERQSGIGDQTKQTTGKSNKRESPRQGDGREEQDGANNAAGDGGESTDEKPPGALQATPVPDAKTDKDKQDEKKKVLITFWRGVFLLPNMLLQHGRMRNNKGGGRTVRNTRHENEGVQVDKEEEKGGHYHRQQQQQCTRNFMDTCRMLFKFEVYHALPALTTIVLYCAAHLSVYEVSNTIVLELTKNVKSQDTVYFFTMILSLILTRLSGGVWSWVDANEHDCVKFVMHNRLRLHDLDARVLRWFHKHLIFKYIVDIVSLYLCFISVAYFLHWRMFPLLFDMRNSVLAGLPSMEYEDVSTYIKEYLLYSLQQQVQQIDADDGSVDDVRQCEVGGRDGEINYDENEETMLDEEDRFKELTKNLTSLDEKYLFSKLTVSSYMSLLGYPQAPVVNIVRSFTFYFTTATLCIFLMKKFGFEFWIF